MAQTTHADPRPTDTEQRPETEQPLPTPASVLEALRQLAPRDRLWVIARALPEAERDLPERTGPPKPLKSLKGVLKDFGPSPSAEDIDEARREMWSSASQPDR